MDMDMDMDIDMDCGHGDGWGLLVAICRDIGLLLENVKLLYSHYVSHDSADAGRLGTFMNFFGAVGMIIAFRWFNIECLVIFHEDWRHSSPCAGTFVYDVGSIFISGVVRMETLPLHLYLKWYEWVRYVHRFKATGSKRTNRYLSHHVNGFPNITPLP